MRASLLTALLGLTLFAAGCTTGQPSTFVYPPIPPHPVMARAVTPAPAAPAPAFTPSRPTRETPRWGSDVAVIPASQWKTIAPDKRNLDRMGKITCITVHHQGDATLQKYNGNARLTLQSIQEVHMGDRHFGDIAYHFLIDPQGRVWEGRPLDWQGAHAGNNDANRGNIGVCLLGDMNETRPTAAQKASLQRLLYKLMAQYKVPASRVYTHREIKEKFGLGTTDCPGRYLQPYVDDLRGNLRAAGR